MLESGFFGSRSANWLADIESRLEKLNLNTLQAIAHGAGNLLEQNAKLPLD